MTERDHIDRAISEAEELHIRLEKLDTFTWSEKWLSLPEKEQELLVEQRNHMTAYLGCLQLRVSSFLSRHKVEDNESAE